MVRRTIKNPKEFQRKTFQEATNIFLQHCRIKNLSPRTLKYYEEDLYYFFSRIRVKYVDEITLEVYEAFLSGELEEGKKITSLNSRIRGFPNLSQSPKRLYDYLLNFLYPSLFSQKHQVSG